MGFVHTSPLHRLPTDVTLKLSDGRIKAQKMMLACVSPVFERMFYGNFKEAKSKVVDLPNDSHKIMKLLLDIVFEENCEMESLDDIIPLMEVVERYQINKTPVQQMCDGAILTQMNYYVLLPKFAKMMHKDNVEKAADKVMKLTNNDFIANTTHAKNIPEQVLLCLLHHNDFSIHDVKIFEFLVYWHSHQMHLGISLQLTDELFACVRYTRIVPQILSSRVANSYCTLVDKQLLAKAYQFIYNSCDKLGNDSGKCFKVHRFRRPGNSLNLKWEAYGKVVITRAHQYDRCPKVSGCFDAVPYDEYIIKSAPLGDEMHSFVFLNLLFGDGRSAAAYDELILAVQDATKQYLLSTSLVSDNLVTLNVYGNFLFLKVINRSCDMVVSTFSINGSNPPFSICIRRPVGFSDKATFSFEIN